jgi:hypothetical protein
MYNTRSVWNRPKLDRHENPNRASVKKKNPSRFWKPLMSSLESRLEYNR